MSIFSYYQPPWIPLHKYNTIQSPSILHTVPHPFPYKYHPYVLVPFGHLPSIHTGKWSCSYTQVSSCRSRRFFSSSHSPPLWRLASLQTNSASRPSTIQPTPSFDVSPLHRDMSSSCDNSVIQMSSSQVLCTPLYFHNDGFLLTPWSVSSSTPHFHHLVVTHGCLHVGCESIKSTFMSSLLNLALTSHRPPSCFATPSSIRTFGFLW